MRARTRVSLALLVAGALHGGLVMWLASLRLPGPAARAPIELTFELAPPPPAVDEPPEPPPPAPPVVEPKPAPAPPVVEPKPAPAPPVVEPKPAPAPPVVEPRPAPAPPAPAPAEREPPPQRAEPSPPAPQPPGRQPDLRRTPDGRLQHDAPRFKAEIQRDGSVRFEDKPDFEIFSEDLPLGSARFDINDALWRLAGKDPYRYQKRKFLKETQALRDEQAATHADEMLGPALVELANTLEKLLGDLTLTAAQKKAAVFELWDDCNDERAGRAARAGIEAFVRGEMPRGSELGYSDDELERLNEHLPKDARFSPYGAARGKGGSGA